jgi:hypothetical protein
VSLKNVYHILDRSDIDGKYVIIREHLLVQQIKQVSSTNKIKPAYNQKTVQYVYSNALYCFRA